jgi:DNA end-binding protein Ku
MALASVETTRASNGLRIAHRLRMASTIWKGQLSFGLVNVPVRLQRAARKERIPLHYVSGVPNQRIDDEERVSDDHPVQPREPDGLPARAGNRPAGASGEEHEPVLTDTDAGKEEPAQVSRIKQSTRTAEQDQPVLRSDLLKGYQVAPEQYVTFRDEELRKLRPATSAVMEIVRAVRLAEIDPVFFETSYYVVPEPAGERAYSLLVSALRDTGYIALATVAMHGRGHVVGVRPGQKGLIAHTMYYVDEVRAGNEYPAEISQVNAKELELAKTFVQAIAGPFAPEEFKDAYREGVQNLISAKMIRKEVAASGLPASVPHSQRTPVADIMDALRKSLELRRPATSERTSAQPDKVKEFKRGPRKQRA